ncbi:MAG: nitroreductase family protein [Cyanobacteria bacterium P01_A01_bin.40]
MTISPLKVNLKSRIINIKSNLKKVPFINKVYRYLKQENRFNSINSESLSKLSNEELLSLMRHESHRIEKTVYNNILEKKYLVYKRKWDKLAIIYRILTERSFPDNEPTLVWSKKIYSAFSNLDNKFIKPNSLPCQEFQPLEVGKFAQFARSRRSVRVWSNNQPEQNVLLKIAHDMVDAARWAPTSGNRQPWRFAMLTSKEDKALLKGIKEEHCTSAPLLIFVGMDTRVYGSLGKKERSVYIDAGAATMQMVLAAHQAGLGVCWNHFADDLVQSRASNRKIYTNFTEKLGIPNYVTPVAIIAVGIPAFIPPEPARMDIENLAIY